MYDIQMDQAAEEFASCWRAAGTHLNNQAQGAIQGWLRAHLNPPFLEHLSFRLGNQLFFVRIEDVETRLKTPGTRSGLLLIAEKSNGHACLMPMRKTTDGWQAVMPGWGLLDAKTNQEINPAGLIDDQLIEMTDWELFDFGVQIVRDDLAKEGFELMSWQSNPEVDPSIWFVGEEGPEWVVVRVVRFPEKDAAVPHNIKDIAKGCEKLSKIGNFASVAVASADDEHDGNPYPLYRGHGMHVRYAGLERI